MLDSSPVSEFNCFSQLGLDSTVPAWVAEPTPVDSGLSQPSTSLYSFMGDIKGMFIELVTRVSHIELRQEATKQFLGTLASGKHEDAVPVEQAGVTGAQQYQSCFSFGYVRSIITLHHPLQCLLGGPSNSLSRLAATSGLQAILFPQPLLWLYKIIRFLIIWMLFALLVLLAVPMGISRLPFRLYHLEVLWVCKMTNLVCVRLLLVVLGQEPEEWL